MHSNDFSEIDISILYSSHLVFACIVAAILFNQIAIIAIPFLWIAIPLLLDYCGRRTENLFWLLLFCLPLSTEWQITPSLGLDFPDEPLMMILTGLFILKILHQPKWFPVNLYKEPLFLLLIAMMGWTMVTIFYANNSWLSLKFLLARIWFIIPFVILPQILLHSQTQIRNLRSCFSFPMFFVLVLQTLARTCFLRIQFC